MDGRRFWAGKSSLAAASRYCCLFPENSWPAKDANESCSFLSPEVVERYKATAPGWQARIDDVLKKAAGL
ncbi:BrnA antitoxin family protein [Agrobacterium rosae]|uniref:BrnA antitoxin family protein n=1 Tax=Agrobacterium rosae TaxID=1972867 RepID=A0AAW9F678_9HYPH|nr:BrnA antitoxin family protein [Agrobacterium rosae]MDX8301020.1 BrnA antitoxin family protein [Agrobacterium rosae]